MDFYLEPMSTDGSVSGVVFDEYNGNNLSMAHIMLFRDMNDEEPIADMMTDEDGHFHFGNLDYGEYYMTVGKEGYYRINTGFEHFLSDTTLWIGMTFVDRFDGAWTGDLRVEGEHDPAYLFLGILNEQYEVIRMLEEPGYQTVELLNGSYMVIAGAEGYNDYWGEIHIQDNTVSFDIVLMEPGYALPPHLHIAHDVPNDQGRQMRLVWESGDPMDWSYFPFYSVWRHVDGTDGLWDYVDLVPWHGMDDYSMVAPTLGDSTHNGIHWSTFMVSGHTEDPNVFFDSEPITGYSVDNLHPQTPGGVQADIGNDGIVLSWHGPVDADFDHHKVYRFNLNAQDPAEEYSTVDTFFVDEVVDGNYEYWVSAVDYNGNESDPSEVVSVLLDVDVAIALPTEFALQQNYPNPFNPSTQIQYAVPTDANVTIAIYDLMGRKVRTLVNGNVTAGYHTTMWNATNDLGQPVAAGMYIYTISSHDYLAKKKMVLLK